MKRRKPGSVPTRVMPRRSRTQQIEQNSTSSTDAGESSQGNPPLEDSDPQKTTERVIAENSNRLASSSGTEAVSSVRAQGSRSRRKRKRPDNENLTGSKSSQANVIDNRKSPEQGCSICLGTVEDRAFTDACYHTFCFECLVEWSRVRAVCPLCKKSFHSIMHAFRSFDDHKIYQVPTSYVSNAVHISSPSNSSSSHFSRITRFWNAESTMPLVHDSEFMLSLRRRIYANPEEMQLRGLWSSDGVLMSSAHHQVTPAMFDNYPLMMERVQPWVIRDVTAIVGNGDVQTVVGIVLDLLRRIPVTSEDFYERLFPYLGLHTRRFLFELDAFAKSSFNVSTYDARAMYGTGANMETLLHLPTEHVEDISSSDDSDIEIVSPAAVASSSESAHNSLVNTITGGQMMPELLNCLQTFHQNLMMSFSFMSHTYHNSGLESPVPGPSGLGQAAATGESDSVGSRASGRSESPMVLSDADSDIVVVDVDRPVHSPIHISSGEDDSTIRQIRSRRQVKRRRRLARARKEYGRELEQNDSLTTAAEYASKDEVPQVGTSLPQNEPHKSTDSNVDESTLAVEQCENSSHIQDESCSRSTNVKLNDHSSASAHSSPSKQYMQTEVGKSADAAKGAYDSGHPKRSRSANSIITLPVMSEPGTDDVKPLTCKKHVSGHKSSKRKVRELVSEKRLAEPTCDSTEKPAADDGLNTAVGSRDLPDTNQPSSVDVPTELTVSSIGESSIASTDFSGNPLPVNFSHEKVTVEQKLSAGDQLDDGMPVPCTSEMPTLPVVLSGLEDIQCSSFATTEVTECCDIADRCLPIVDENSPSCEDNACYSSGDVVQMYPVDADELPKNNACVENDGVNVEDCNVETSAASECIHPGSDDLADTATDPVSPGDVWSSSVSEAITGCLLSSPDLPSLSDPCLTLEHTDYHSESSSDINMSAASSSCWNSQIQIHSVRSCGLENQDSDKGVSQPLWNDSNDSLLFVPQHNESIVFADISPHSNSSLKQDTSCLCIDTVSSKNQLPFRDTCSTMSGTVFPDCQSIDCSLTDRRRSVGSPSHAGLVIDKNQASPAILSPVINNCFVINSPVGIESSDSEVEWLETGESGRQRCISISSSDSSVVCSLSDMDGAESVLSDSDSVEIFDDEPQTESDQSADSRQLYDTPQTPHSGDQSTESRHLCDEPQTSQSEDQSAESRHLCDEPQTSHSEDQSTESRHLCDEPQTSQSEEDQSAIRNSPVVINHHHH